MNIHSKKVVLAYSGGLDTSVILHWLIAKGYEVICFVANVGQAESFEDIKQKALTIGARNVIIHDLRTEFITDYIFPSLQANAVYENSYLLGTALARPLIAKKQIEVALQEHAHAVAHGATGKGNDQLRFELAYMTCAPELKIISPWKMPEFLAQFKGRSDLLTYAQKHAIPVSSTPKKPYSIDENIMHTSYEGGPLEDLSYMPDETLFQKTTSPYNAPNKPAHITIEFKTGIPITLIDNDANITITKPLELFMHLNRLASVHAIGRLDIVENRCIGMKSRGIYETPGATVLYKAHRDLEQITVDKQVQYLKDSFAPMIAQLMYNGLWFSPEMIFLMSAIKQSQHHVEGMVSMTLYKGNTWVTTRASKKSLYQQTLVSMDEEGNFDATDAKGFIKIQGLRLKNAAVQQGKTS